MHVCVENERWQVRQYVEQCKTRRGTMIAHDSIYVFLRSFTGIYAYWHAFACMCSYVHVFMCIYNVFTCSYMYLPFCREVMIWTSIPKRKGWNSIRKQTQPVWPYNLEVRWYIAPQMERTSLPFFWMFDSTQTSRLVAARVLHTHFLLLFCKQFCGIVESSTCPAQKDNG